MITQNNDSKEFRDTFCIEKKVKIYVLKYAY